MRASRRSFLSYAAMAAGGSALGLRPFGAMNALAQTTTDYRALVCVFLFGGNDSNNMLVPFDTTGYGNYASLRGPIALARNAVLPLTPTPNFALHPNLPEVQALYNSGKAAFLTNVGTLIQPTTQAQYLANQGTQPQNLFSHPDQQLEWQNQAVSASTQSGWAGRMADRLSVQYNAGAQIPMICSLDGDTIFCNGESTQPVSLGTAGAVPPYCADGSYCPSRLQTAQQLATLSSGVSLVQADNDITTNAYRYNEILMNAMASVPALKTVFPTAGGNPFGAQLLQVAQMMQVQAALGVKRQIFFVGGGDFDTHGSQMQIQATLLSQLSPALGAFYNATVELGLASQVTTFTCSDFSRTFQPNSAAGSDHAWGGHHIIMGGAVKGGQMYGSFPTLALGGPDDSDKNGRWIPTTSSSQYAATLAQWFGVASADLGYVLPSLGNFSKSNLGFLG
jgi:uncharacterized protein (DUF1501 family)